MVRVLRGLADETVSQTYERLKTRIDELGVVQPNVSLDKDLDLIFVELPGIENPQRARDMLQARADLEFWDVYRSDDNGVLAAFTEADNRLRNADKYELMKSDSTGTVAETETVKPDSNQVSGPLLSKLSVFGQPGSAVLASASKNNIPLIDEYLAQPYVKALFPRDGSFAWSMKAGQGADGKDNGLYELYLLKAGREGALMDGSYVRDANSSPNERGQVAVSLRMDGEGARKWGQVTTRAANDGNRPVAIVLDGKVVSAPSVRTPILDGNSEITGNFSAQEGSDLSSILKVGKLPAKAQIVQESVVGPSLGQDNINKSLISLLLSLVAVMVFMIWYYRKGGAISVIALMVNLFFLIGALMSLGTVLTLPGMAGIVLTMGMAVDANVIIFERIREEFRAGKSALLAMTDGFKYSMSAVIDGNLTTFLAALVLFYFGIGPIKGFGVVLAVGILTTLFTAVLLVRMMSEWYTQRGNDLSFYSPMADRLADRFNLDWMKMRKKAYIFSSVVILIGIGSFFARGFELGVEFKGGYSYNVQFDKATDLNTLRNNLTKAFDGASTIVKAVSTANTFNITTSYRINESGTEVADQVVAKLHEAVVATGSNMTLDQFKNTESKGTHITSSSKVGPTIADDIKSSAWKTAILGMLGIFLYILLRFSRWQYSAGAVIALIHDVLFTMSFFTLLHGILPFSLEVDSAIIAAILTLIGYSVNDTVIVYDRIREYVHTYSKLSMSDIINKSINSVLTRTVVTSLTVFLVLLVLFIFGGSSIRGFSFALLIGVVVGTYSSIFIAAPIMLDLSRNLDLTEVQILTVEEKIAARNPDGEEKPAKKGKAAKKS